MSQSRRPSNQHRPSVTRNSAGGLRFGMFAACVIRDGSPDLAGKPKELYTVLVTFADVQGRDTDKGYPYRSALAAALGCSTKTVDRATAALEKIGLVTAHRRKLPGGMENDANRYELHDGWLIHGLEPGSEVPPQLVARYGHLIPGFDVTAYLGGGDTSVSTYGDMGVSTGGDTGVAQSRTLSQEPSSRDDAPSARSAADGRRPSTGSRGSSAGGSAASGKTKPHFSREERRQYDAFVQALPAPLADLVPKGLPVPLVRAVLAAVDVSSPEGRTVEQLVEYRLLPKWDRYYSRRDEAGPLEKPVGVLVAMLRRDAECGDPRCDERKDVDTGEACRSCEQRQENKRSEKAPTPPAADPVIPAPRRIPAADSRFVECQGPRCSLKMFPTPDGLCRECREDVIA